uniref:Fam-a protein n=1 Tax=Strongyloides venezuelensis TaxID=75913 RepID=A0A0K0F475_STRVS
MKLLIHISAAFVLFLLINLDYFKCSKFKKAENKEEEFNESDYEINNKSREAENICTFCVSIYNILHNSSYKFVNASYIYKENLKPFSPRNVLFFANSTDFPNVTDEFTGIYYPNKTLTGQGMFCDLIKLNTTTGSSDGTTESSNIKQNLQKGSTTKKPKSESKKKKNKGKNKKKTA